MSKATNTLGGLGLGKVTEQVSGVTSKLPTSNVPSKLPAGDVTQNLPIGDLTSKLPSGVADLPLGKVTDILGNLGQVTGILDQIKGAADINQAHDLADQAQVLLGNNLPVDAVQH